MRNLLVAVDGDSPARTRSAVARAIQISRQGPARIHLLSVQPAVSGHVAAYFGEGELLQLQQTAGDDELAMARAQLDAAEVPAFGHVRVGRRAETIARAAHDLRCETILMGQAPDDGLVSRAFGSVAEQVRQMVGPAGECRVIGS